MRAGLEVPLGIDPEFIAALPPDMRQSVINEHQQRERLARMRSEQAAAAAPATGADGAQPPTGLLSINASTSAER